MVFQCINIRQVPWEVLKTAAFGLGFQHLPRDLANVNAWKTMFDPYINNLLSHYYANVIRQMEYYIYEDRHEDRTAFHSYVELIHFQGQLRKDV